MKYTLRKAVLADKERIEALFIEMLRTIYQRDDVEGYEEGYLDKYFEGTGDWICVAEAEGRTAAYLSIEEHRGEPDFIYLDDCSVAKENRNCGIGTALLNAAERYAADRNITELFLHVEKSNVLAHRLYERIGYTDYEDEGNRIRMRKII